ncbi:hypothetical protein NIES4071_00850 [Calothrix sp. NIES-4071]|nr:hypothetical protein NIES4071_00850 [Calothrix sp. NIES-4071]BAZ54431.1 hypothetical protein NIES4105_00840 [Calothrix sp. NIES-4105]
MNSVYMVCLQAKFKLFAVTFYWLSLAHTARAQIVPDTTLPINSSVTPGCSVCTIEAGTLRGNNLFHSFTQFSVPTGGAALFNNGVNVQNILTRVTGTNVSNIDGVIKAIGGANLFIINPNGIIFGANAQLDIGGSFVGTTATGVKFADGTEFSAVPPLAPLLTISTPIGLSLTNNSGAITVQGRGHRLVSSGILFPIIQTQNASGLKVKPGQTLALVGGNILLDGGVLGASDGRVELGSVYSGEVELNWAPKLQLAYTGISNFADIELKQRGLVDVSGFNSGSIQLQGRSVNISGGSLLFVENLGFFPSGSIDINATESLKLSDATPDTSIRSGINSQNFGSAQSGDVNITTKQLTLENGASIATRTFSAAKSGNINVNAATINVSGFLATTPSVSSTISTTSNSIGNAGNIDISAQNLSVYNSGTISSTNFNAGSGGNITVNADTIDIRDSDPITVPSAITAPNFGTGQAGKLILNTRTLSILSGGQVSTSSFNSGNAGNIIINASEFVNVSGRISLYSSSISSAVDKPIALAGQLLGLFDVPTGTSGDITINTGSLKITNDASTIVRNQGFGKGGNLQINADSMFISNSGGLSASTASGQGGNINLKLNDLQMRRNSYITTSAGNGNGGNININTDTLVAFENSDITANSQDSRGGRVTINAQAVLGTEFRSLQTPQSDITASSGLGASFNGIVDVNTIATGSIGLVELPESVADTNNQISNSCTMFAGDKFVIIRNGGLPSSPDDLLIQQTGVNEVVDLVSQTSNKSNFSIRVREEVVEAQRLIVDDGEVYLVAGASPILPRPTCNGGA